MEFTGEQISRLMTVPDETKVFQLLLLWQILDMPMPCSIKDKYLLTEQSPGREEEFK